MGSFYRDSKKLVFMQKKEYYSWEKFDKDVTILIYRLKRVHKRFDGVWGPARGGLPLAVTLSHALNLPFLSRPRSKRTLIVDDLADTGKTLKKYAGKNFIVTIFYHPQSIFVPNVWLRKKGKRWILFPWEKSK